MIFMKLTFVFSLKSNCNSIENLCISAAQTYPFTGYPCLMDFPSKTRIKSMAPMDCMCLVCTMVLVAWIHSGVSNSKRKGITINSGGKLVQVRTIQMILHLIDPSCILLHSWISYQNAMIRTIPLLDQRFSQLIQLS